jgi:N-acetyl-gamma-glutamyl-phosphate reductase
LRLLADHPHVTVASVTSRRGAGRRIDAEFPHLRGVCDGVFVPPDEAELEALDLVFFATPKGTAMAQAPQLLERGVRVIDIGADFRLKDATLWTQWYGTGHACPERLEQAVYGLPEHHRGALKGAMLVGNPGCYPTAVELALLPLVEAGVVALDQLVASATSGASGAGRSERQDLLLAEQADNTRAYAASGHRHAAEIRQELEGAARGPVRVTFVPHLVPQVRGIHATTFADLTSDTDVQALYERRFASEPFVDVLPWASHPQTRGVRGSNVCRIALHRPAGEPQRVVVLAVIDNLVKGAAGQAVQNMNLMLGFDERCGLDNAGLAP